MMNMQGDDVMELDYGYKNWNKYEDMNGISIRQRRQAVASMFPEVTFGQVNFQQTALVKIPLLIRTSPTANIFDFVECLVMESEVRPPDIILSIITNPSDHKSFKLYYHREQFIVGMQNIMETSSLWIITHGRDCGIVSLLGEALHRYQESIEYQNKWCETLRKQMNFMSNVSLISIVNEKDVLENGGSYSKFMDDTLERTILHLAQIDGSYYLNKYHSIHIVVTNNNISSGCLNDPAENFRCRFEKHLYTHVVPKLKISTHLNALRPRELQLYKFKSNDVEVELTFRWRNPYYASKYYNFFEDFVMIVYGCIHPLSKEKEELKSVSMKPKRDVMYCTVKIMRDYQQHLVFVLYSRTLYGSSQEASYYVDLSKFPCNNKRKSTKDPVFINLEMYLDCIASDTAVCVNFTPYLTSSHIKIMIRSLDQDKSQWSEQHTIETGVSVFHFTGLTPNTMYEVSIEPLKITESKILRMAGPFTKCFQTKVRDTFSDTTCEVYDDNLNVTTPMIYLVCGGNSDNIKKILHCINTRSAGILIMEGTRGAADLIGVSIDIHSERPTKLEDDDLIREVLLKYLYIEMFKKENTDHPKIREVLELLINIGKFCEKVKRVRKINIWQTKLNLSKISKEYLKCWILCGGTKEKSAICFKRDVRLAIALNNTTVAQAEIFEQSKYKDKVVTNELFEMALLTKDRERFVDLFLEYGFKVHPYLTEDRIKFIFEYEDELDPYDRDFFITTTVEGILGLTGDEDKLPDDFVQRELPHIIEHLTGLQKSFSQNDSRIIFLSKSDGDFTVDDSCVDISTSYIRVKDKRLLEKERESLKILIVYAVLMNRYNLATYIWKHSTSPLLTALFCAALYSRLSDYCHESYQKTQANKFSGEFTNLAVKLLDLTFVENEQITHESLQSKYIDWNDRSPIEFAHGVHNKVFMAHPSCQKWITRTFFGEITLREMTTNNYHMPSSVKILTCALLIFPMYFWINFSPIGKGVSQEPTTRYRFKIDSYNMRKIKSEFGMSMRGSVIMSPLSLDSPTQSTKYFQHFSTSNKRHSTPTKLNDKETMSNDIAPNQGIIDYRYISYNSAMQSLHRSTEIFKARLASSPPFWKKIMLLWGAPVTKFSLDAFFYGIYLVVFSIVTIWPTCGNILLDTFFWIWSASITFENTRLCYTKSKTINHLPLFSAVLDISIQSVFLIGFVWIRIYGLWDGRGVTPHEAKSFVGAFLIYYFLRVFRLYYPIHPKLGPAMVKLTYMITDDFISYLYIFIVFMIPTGVAVTAIIFPHHPLDIDILIKIMKRGIMALFRTDTRDLESINPSLCRINLTKETCIHLSNGISFSYDNDNMYSVFGINNRTCSITTWIVWVMVLQYGYMSSVFLRSLLTAMFGITGRNVSAISEQIWMYDRYEIIMDYERKPRLPPPFCIISYLLSCFAFAYKNVIRPELFVDKSDHDDHKPGLYRDVQKMDSFSQFVSMLTEFTRGDTSTWANQPRWKNDTSNKYWKLKAEKVLEIVESKDKTTETLKMINLRANIVQQITLENKNMDSLLKRLIALAIVKQNSKTDSTNLPRSINNLKVHSLARCSPYPFTNISRFAIDDSKISWDVEYESYKPDKLNLVPDFFLTEDMAFDTITVDQTILEKETLYRNPIGRTGLEGKGCLPVFGPNRFLMCIITRRQSSNECIEFLCKTIESLKVIDWCALPYALINTENNEDSAYLRLCQKLDPNLATNIIESYSSGNRFEDAMMIEFFNKAFYYKRSDWKPRVSNIYNGYHDDKRNTDNAWVEFEMWNFHVDGMCVSPFSGFTNWLPLNLTNAIFAGMEREVRLIEALYN